MHFIFARLSPFIGYRCLDRTVFLLRIKRRQSDRVLDQSIGIPVQKILARHDTVPQLPFRLPTGHSGNIAAAPGDLFAFGERIGFFLL